MASRAAPQRAPPFIDPPGYARHRPEETLVYGLYPYEGKIAQRGSCPIYYEE